jgi:hypothetical protein
MKTYKKVIKKAVDDSPNSFINFKIGVMIDGADYLEIRED